MKNLNISRKHVFRSVPQMQKNVSLFEKKGSNDVFKARWTQMEFGPSMICYVTTYNNGRYKLLWNGAKLQDKMKRRRVT